MMRIEDGQAEQHETPLAVNAAATPGVQQPTAVAGQLTPADQGGVLADISGVDFTADAATAMASGMSADADRRGRYLVSMAPLGGSAGDLMTLSSPPLDPGAAPGEAEPWGALYDPPRGY
jgi:hypothetical protein